MSTNSLGLTRRQALTGVVGAIAAPSLVKSASTEAQAAAPMMGGSNPSHYRFKLGSFEITTIFDGFVKVPRIHPIFGNNQKLEDVAMLAKANNLPGDKMAIPFTPIVVNTGKEVVLFDAGNGAARRKAGRADYLRLLAVLALNPNKSILS